MSNNNIKHLKINSATTILKKGKGTAPSYRFISRKKKEFLHSCAAIA